MNILAIDPGRDKCGFAALQDDGGVLKQKVICTAELAAVVQAAVCKYHPTALIIGNGTTSKAAQKIIKQTVPDLRLIVVDEYRTTDDAKKRYWLVHPPKGWRRLLPVTMQVPPVPVDDFVAVMLAERYVQKIKK
ncbi:MAG: pre-16S rRNA-processing nuclease YqgF [Selenomonadaceae bacterium]